VTSLSLLSKYPLIMELRFDAMLYFNSGNKYSDAGCMFPIPDLQYIIDSGSRKTCNYIISAISLLFQRIVNWFL